MGSPIPGLPMPEASLACKKLLLHPLHGALAGLSPHVSWRDSGRGGEGTWLVNKGLFSLGWESPSGASGRTGGRLAEAP